VNKEPQRTWTEVSGERLEAFRATHYGHEIGIARALELADGTLRVLPGKAAS
jgi:hypothetical protein